MMQINPLMVLLTVWLVMLVSPTDDAFWVLGPSLYLLPALVLAYLFSAEGSINSMLLLLVTFSPSVVLVLAAFNVSLPESLLGNQVVILLLAVATKGGSAFDVAAAIPYVATVMSLITYGVYVWAGQPCNKLMPIPRLTTRLSRPKTKVLVAAQPVAQVSAPALPKLTALEAVLAEHKLDGAREDGKPVVGPVVTRRFVRLPAGRSFTASLTDVARDLGYEKVGLVRNAKPSCMALDVPTVPRQTFTLTDVLTKAKWPRGAKGKLPVCFAVDVEGNPYTDDLATWVQVIVAGTTGAGKSVAMNAIILSLMASGAKFGLLIADGKGDDFAPYYAKSKHLLKLPTAPSIARTPEDIAAQLEALIGIMDARADDHSIVRTPIIYLVDELLDVLMAGGKKLRVELENKLVRLAHKGRSFGILLLTATQTPSSAALPEPFRANVPTRLGMTTEKAKQSAIIIGESGCEQLLERGDALLKRGSSIKRIHCANITQADFDRYMR